MAKALAKAAHGHDAHGHGGHHGHGGGDHDDADNGGTSIVDLHFGPQLEDAARIAQALTDGAAACAPAGGAEAGAPARGDQSGGTAVDDASGGALANGAGVGMIRAKMAAVKPGMALEGQIADGDMQVEQRDGAVAVTGGAGGFHFGFGGCDHCQARCLGPCRQRGARDHRKGATPPSSPTTRPRKAARRTGGSGSRSNSTRSETMSRATCQTCRMIRRFVLSFGAGVMVMLQVTGRSPGQSADNGMWRGFMFVAMVFLVAGVFFRMREMRNRMRRRA